MTFADGQFKVYGGPEIDPFWPKKGSQFVRGKGPFSL